MRIKYLIVGAGLTGLSTAYHLRKDYLLVEAVSEPGGTAGTLNYKGFKLDNAIHILFFSDKTIFNWLTKSINVELIEKRRESTVWINNKFVKFPIQYNLNNLHLRSRLKSLSSLLNPARKLFNEDNYLNFKDYSLKHFGKYLTDIFFRPYNEKLYGVPISELNTDWFGSFVPDVSLKKILLGALGLADNNYGPNLNFYYPAEGGISTIAAKIYSTLSGNVLFNCSLNAVSVEKKIASLSDGSEVEFQYLINTMPLNNLLKLIDPLPQPILICNSLLRKNSTTVLHILFKGVIKNKDHWIYFPEMNIPFYRITIPGNINPANCPEGYSALTLEFGGDQCENEIILNFSIKILKSIGLLNNEESELETLWRLIDCGYVIYDDRRKDAVRKIFNYLNNNNIISIGRYGAWEYSNMEVALLHGRKTAERLLS